MAGFIGGILARLTTETRDIDAPRVSTSPRTLAGVSVTPDTAATLSAVWACLRYLSQTVAVLPWHVMRDGQYGAEIASRNPVDWLIYKRPNPEWSSFQFRETLVHWALRWGNGYAEIERDVSGRPKALWPIHPERVEVCRDVDTGEIYYEVNNGTGGPAEIPMMDMFHLRGFGEGPVGVNVVSYASQSLGSALAAQLYGASFFGNGANVSGVVTMKRPLKDAGAMERVRAEFNSLYKGVRNANKTAVLDNDMEWSPVGTDPEKAQLILSRQHDVEEVCRWFGVPPHKVMHLLRATFSNIEHQAIEVVVDSISPWVKRFEDEADWKLFGQVNRQGFYTKMNMNALLRGDMKARMEFYKGMQFVGAYSANRILQAEDEPTIGPDGDIHVMQSQFVPLSRIGAEPVAATPATAATPTTPDPAPDEGEPEEDAAAVTARAEFHEIMALTDA